jgi:hypothetical protein
VKRIHEEFGGRAGLVVLGLNLDRNKDNARRFVKRRGISWRQGLLGGWSDTEIPEQLGVHAIPAYFLVRPDGRLDSKASRAQDLRARLTELLSADTPVETPPDTPGADSPGVDPDE